MKKYLVILTIGLLFLCCNKNSNEEQKGKSTVDKDFNPLALTSMRYQNLDSLESWMRDNFDYSLSHIRSRYGKPDSIRYDTVRNIHTDFIDSIVTLDYVGVEFSLYHVSEYDSYLMLAATLKGNCYFPNIGLNYEMSRDSLQKIMDKPYESMEYKNNYIETVLRYRAESESCFEFTFQNNRLIKIDYYSYID